MIYVICHVNCDTHYVCFMKGVCCLCTRVNSIVVNSIATHEYVDMRSQGGLLLEDLMKIERSSFELS